MRVLCGRCDREDFWRAHAGPRHERVYAQGARCSDGCGASDDAAAAELQEGWRSVHQPLAGTLLAVSRTRALAVAADLHYQLVVLSTLMQHMRVHFHHAVHASRIDVSACMAQVKPVHSGQTGKVTNFLGQLEDVGILDAGRIRVRLGRLGWKGRAWCKPSLDLASATADCGHARVITEASAPFRILQVNRSWSLMCGFSPEEARGETLSIIQGKGRASPTQHTQTSCVSGSLARLTNALAQGQHTTALLLNYRKSGEPFLNFLQVPPA